MLEFLIYPDDIPCSVAFDMAQHCLQESRIQRAKFITSSLKTFRGSYYCRLVRPSACPSSVII